MRVNMRHKDFGQIIAGTLKGRKIQFSVSKNLRPTRRVMREALFSSLYSQVGDFEGLSVLDGFCGSGMIGLEFISRGAGFVDFVDSDGHNYRQFKDNIAPFMNEIEDHFRFWHGKLAWMITQVNADTIWDVIWLDPPFDTIPRNEILDLLEGRRGKVFVLHTAKEKKDAYHQIFNKYLEDYPCVYEREFGVSHVSIYATRAAPPSS